MGIFFNCLVNLNKFIAYETRDLFSLNPKNLTPAVQLPEGPLL